MRFGQGVKKLTRLAVALLLLTGVGALLMSKSTPPYNIHEKAYYADPATIDFVRPGLVFKIVSVQIGTDGTVQVRFTMQDPAGLGLDRTGVNTPGTVNSSFVIATIPAGQTYYKNYILRTATDTATGVSAQQPGSDSGGSYTQNAAGDYTYTFGTKLPSGFDQTATHTVGVYGSRNLTSFGLSTYYADNVYTFVPNGAAVTVTRDIIRTQTCNKCHYSLGVHGGSRKSLELCILCHYSGVLDPYTGNSIAADMLFHKLHTGANLPSVQAGTPYQIVGFQQMVSDFSKIVFPPDGATENCQVCHESTTGAAQANAWVTNPNREACGSCHDNVNFATGLNHTSANLPEFDDNSCKNCHIPVGENDFDASIMGAHVVPHSSSLIKGVVAKIVSVANLKPGQNPSVTFTLTDKAGNPLDPSKINRVAITIAGPTTDYVAFANTATPGYVTETAASAKANGSSWTYTFSTAIPANASGTWAVAIEARTSETLLAGTLTQVTTEYGSPNPFTYVSVDGSTVVPRRTVVALANCNQCHNYLTLHGENRNQIEYCVMCHNPGNDDRTFRPASAAPTEGISFAMFIHRIHSGNLQTRDFTIYGFGGTKVNFNDIVFPAPLNNCAMCHVGGSENLPIGAVAQVSDPRGFINPSYPTTAACLGCHATQQAAAHALINTSPTLGESCVVCHGANADFSVAQVHAQ